MSSNGTLLEVQDLSVNFKVGQGWLNRGQTVHAVSRVSLNVAPGETFGLVGESGSGKSTTVRAVLQLVRPSSGSVKFEGEELTSASKEVMRSLRRKAQMVFQDPYSCLNQRLKVGAIIKEPLDIHEVGSQQSRRQRVLELLDRVGLPAAAADRYPHQFSGGQRQRIGIARALATEPSLVICDEPVAALDVSIQAQVLQLLADLQAERGMAYLFIAHDLNVVRHVSRRAAVMYLGRIVEQGPSSSLFAAPKHPYTQALLSAVRLADPQRERARKRIVLTGEIPSPTQPPSGCTFRTRCRHAQPVCAEAEPALEDAGDGTLVACHFWRILPAPAGPADPDDLKSSARSA